MKFLTYHLVILCFSFLAFGCKADNIKYKLINLADNITVQATSNLVVKKNSPVGDFSLFDFEKSEELLLRVYVGNAPVFPSEICSNSINIKVIGGLDSKEVKCDNSILLSETLVDVDIESGWPKYIHFMLQQTNNSDLESIGQKIIDSLIVRTQGDGES